MGNSDWEMAIPVLSNITVKANPNNQPVSILNRSEDLYCIGVGTDAAVFRYKHAPGYAFKVYADKVLYKKEIELSVYQRLGKSPFTPTLYGSGDRFLVLSFEHGTTLFDCLLQGIHIPTQVIDDVETARTYIKERGLNPRDIHLKNILNQDGRGKILDVSEYVNPGNDFRWEYLKRGYEEYYHYIDGKPLPFWLLETVRKWYNQTSDKSFLYEEFIKKVTKLAWFWK